MTLKAPFAPQGLIRRGHVTKPELLIIPQKQCSALSLFQLPWQRLAFLMENSVPYIQCTQHCSVSARSTRCSHWHSLQVQCCSSIMILPCTNIKRGSLWKPCASAISILLPLKAPSEVHKWIHEHLARAKDVIPIQRCDRKIPSGCHRAPFLSPRGRHRERKVALNHSVSIPGLQGLHKLLKWSHCVGFRHSEKWKI